MLVYALLALAILIAMFGTGNTPRAVDLRTHRELGVMRAVGMTRPQLPATIRWESVIIALQGTILGLLIGVFFGWALVLAMKNQGITMFSLPVPSLVIVVLLAALAGVAAAHPAQPPGSQAQHPARDRQRVGRPGRRQRQMRPLSLRQWTSSGRGEDVFGYRTYGHNDGALTFIKATHTLAWSAAGADPPQLLPGHIISARANRSCMNSGC